MQLFWTVVTYLLKNVKHGIEHDIDSTYGDIRDMETYRADLIEETFLAI